MKSNITARDIKIFLIGIFTALTLVFLYNWKDNATDIKEGLKQGWIDYETSRKN